jgi:RNA polymerase sigma-70 factor (ECF subfamily)
MDALFATDPEILVRCAAGDRDATESLLRSLWGPAYRAALALAGGDCAIAHDSVQNACLAVFLKIGRLRDPARFMPWFMRILARCVTKELKARARWHPLTERELAAPDVSHDDWSLLRLCVLALPSSLREPLVLNAVMGYSSNEVAEILGIPSGTVRFRVHCARRRLERVLELGNSTRDSRENPVEGLAGA